MADNFKEENQVTWRYGHVGPMPVGILHATQGTMRLHLEFAGDQAGLVNNFFAGGVLASQHLNNLAQAIAAAQATQGAQSKDEIDKLIAEGKLEPIKH